MRSGLEDPGRALYRVWCVYSNKLAIIVLSWTQTAQWLAREAGCLDPNCEFLHDEKACREDRERILQARRETLEEATVRDTVMWQNRERNSLYAQRPELRRAAMSAYQGIIPLLVGAQR